MKDSLRRFVHFWQSDKQGNLHYFFKVTAWGFKDVLSLSAKRATVRFATVGGYDHNNCYQEHNNWESYACLHDPMSTATKIFNHQATAEELKKIINQYRFTIARFTYEDSNGCYFNGQENGKEVMVQITIPIKELQDFVNRLLFLLPELHSYINQRNEMNTWMVFHEHRLVASIYVNETLDQFQSEKLRPILESLEGVYHFFR
jgi:hypothetical protein